MVLLRFASIVPGKNFVMIPGKDLIPHLCVDNWETALSVKVKLLII